jgi:hypothetical protein
MKNEDTKKGAGARTLNGKDHANTTDSTGNAHQKGKQTLNTFAKPTETKGGQRPVVKGKSNG